MTRSDDHRIADILDSCQELETLTRMRDEATTPHWILTRAAERLLDIIGEASGALTQARRAQHDQIPWRDITRLRILLAHHYQRVDQDQVWTIAEQEIPRLAAALRGQPPPSTP